MYNLYRVKTDIPDPHMINELEDELNHGPYL
jgi:hypothetical protein